MTTATFDAIVHRHRPDAAEQGRFCRSCGRPWPCDVRAIVDQLGPGTPAKAALAAVPRRPMSWAARRA
jgi:hypothetical protein